MVNFRVRVRFELLLDLRHWPYAQRVWSNVQRIWSNVQIDQMCLTTPATLTTGLFLVLELWTCSVVSAELF